MAKALAASRWRTSAEIAPCARIFRDERGIVGRVTDRGHAPEVARGRTEQREPARVDHPDRLIEADHATTDLGRECAHAHDHDVDGADAVLREAGGVLGHMTARQDAGVDLGVVGADPSTDEVRHARQLGHIVHLEAGL